MIEAENFFAQRRDGERRWLVQEDSADGRQLTMVRASDDCPKYKGDEGPMLTYPITFSTPGTYRAWAF